MLESVAKKSVDKISVGGRKYALRRRRPDGVAEAEVIGIGTPAENDGDDRELLVPLVRDGEVVGREPLDGRPRPARRGPRRAAAGRPADVRGRPVIPTLFEGERLMAAADLRLLLRVAEVGTSITVVLPQATEEQIGLVDQPLDGPPPVLYLLHGLSDDHTAWLRYTSIERYAAARGLAVVMPAVDRSFYADEAHGHRYWNYVSEELPAVVGQFFRVSQDPADTFVAGLSMGGYGALKLALTHPERYAAAASPVRRRWTSRPARRGLTATEIVDRVFDGRSPTRRRPVRPPGRARRRRSRRCYISAAAPRTGCSASNRRFVDGGRRPPGVDVTIDFRPGDHEWGLWDAHDPGRHRLAPGPAVARSSM